MHKHLIFDVDVVLDLWLQRGTYVATKTLLDAACDSGAKGWMVASSLLLLETAATQELEQRNLSPEQVRDNVSQYLQRWLDQIEVLTVYGFEQVELCKRASNLHEAQIAAAARSLPSKHVCIVTDNQQFDALGEISYKTPEQALIWLTQSISDDKSIKPIAFIDLPTQQAAIRTELERRLELVLRHGQYILGPEVQELEGRLAEYTGAKYCITVASGTDALLVSLMALGIGPGDEVITTPFTFIATVEVIALVGAKPVFVDIDPATCNINPHLIATKITPNTKAIMPVSLYGQPAEMDVINSVAKRYGLPVIEDAAQSFGADYKGRKSCNLSTIGCTSFFPSKPLGCYGDGGAIFTSDELIAQTCRELRIHGQSQRYLHTKIGVGARMDSLQCAVVLAKLKRFPWELERRQEIALRYDQALNTTVSNHLRPLPWPQPNRTSVFAQYTVITQNREFIQSELHKVGIPTAVHYPIAIAAQPAYQKFTEANTLPVAVALAQQVLSLPMGPDLQLADQDKIIRNLRQAQASGN